MYDDVLQAVIDLAQATNPYAAITRGALPADNGITMTYASGAPSSTFPDKSTVQSCDIVLNGKNTSQQSVISALGAIHTVLTRARNYPNNASFQIMNIITTNAPNYLGREPNSQFLYGSSLEVTFYWR